MPLTIHINNYYFNIVFLINILISIFFLEFRSYVNNIISTDSEVNKGIYNNVRDTKDVAISEQNDKNKLDKFGC